MNQPGFQKSWTSGARVTFYPRDYDPIAFRSGDPSVVLGRKDPTIGLVGVQTLKALGSAGQWQVSIKAGPRTEEFVDALQDDDWVDIEFYIGSRFWHVMRGSIDTLQHSVSVSNGATSETLTITGRDFTKVWEMTPLWFSPYLNNKLQTTSVASQLLTAKSSLQDRPDKVAQTYLFKFLRAISSDNAVDWSLPESMPGVGDPAFISNVVFDNELYSNVPPRRAYNANSMTPEGTLWELAVQMSDPTFIEFYTDVLGPSGSAIGFELNDPNEPISVSDSKMSVVFRDRPFPIVASAGEVGEYVDRWLDIPTAYINRQSIQSMSLTKGGHERSNAFWVQPVLGSEQTNKSVDIMKPLWNPESVKYHGMRRFDVTSRHIADIAAGANFDDLPRVQRYLLRDWYALNPFFRSGTVQLGHGRPDIKIGTRLQIAGRTETQEPMQYYIEAVQHSWSLRPGLRTNMEVTRGFRGRDDVLRDTLQKMTDEYELGELLP
jgi:hypothetical protein